MPKSAVKGLNKRQRLLLKTVVESKLNESEAGRRLGLCQQTVNAQMHKIRKKIGFQGMMEFFGVSDEFLVNGLIEGCLAKKPISCNIYLKNKDGEICELKDADGKTKDFIDIEDYSTRHKFYQTLLEVKGLVKQNWSTRSNENAVINIHYGHRIRYNTSPIREGQGGKTKPSKSDAKPRSRLGRQNKSAPAI